MINYDTAIEQVLAHAVRLPASDVLLNSATGCALADDIYAPIDLPPFDNSAMDGYAVRVSGSSNHQATKLNISQTIKAGDAPRCLEHGTCAKIMTGAMLPQGADAVVPIEDADISCDEMSFSGPIKIGKHIRFKGEDVKKGELVAVSGTVVNSRIVALLSALGLKKAAVVPFPRVRLMTTGSELQAPGDILSQGKIFDSNAPALLTALKEIGITAEVLHIPDDRDMMFTAIKNALENCDLLVTTGGVSVGDYDHVKEVFNRLEVKEIFHKVAIKPGKPLYFGVAGGSKPIFGLPGNPVSCMVTFAQFVRPAIYKMMGKYLDRKRRTAVASEPIVGSTGKRDLLCGICEETDVTIYVKPAGVQGSAMLRSFALANCTIMIPDDKEKIEKGGSVEVEPW